MTVSIDECTYDNCVCDCHLPENEDYWDYDDCIPTCTAKGTMTT